MVRIFLKNDSIKKQYFILAFYFVIPIAVMIVLYTLIIWKIYRNSTAMKMRSFYSKNFINKI